MDQAFSNCFLATALLGTPVQFQGPCQTRIQHVEMNRKNMCWVALGFPIENDLYESSSPAPAREAQWGIKLPAFKETIMQIKSTEQ